MNVILSLLLFVLIPHFLYSQPSQTRAKPLPDHLLYQDNDKDGVVNKYDICMDEPGPASNDGCPELVSKKSGKYNKGIWGRYLPYADFDRDGVLNKYDQCPEEAGIRALEGCNPPQGQRPVALTHKAEPDIKPSDILQRIDVEPKTELLSDRAKDALNQVVAQSIGKPQSRLYLIVYINKKNKEAIQYVENIREYLIVKGIAKQRIYTRSIAQYPELKQAETLNSPKSRVIIAQIF